MSPSGTRMQAADVGSMAMRVAQLADLCLQPVSAREGSQALIELTSDVRTVLAAVPFASSSGARKFLFVRCRTLLRDLEVGARALLVGDFFNALQTALDAGDLHEGLVQLVINMIRSLDAQRVPTPSPVPLAHVLYRASLHEPLSHDLLLVCRNPAYQAPMLTGVAYYLAQDALFGNDGQWNNVEFSDEHKAISFLASSCNHPFLFRPSEAFVQYMTACVDAIPTRIARRSFIDRFAPQLAERLLFLEPEEEDILQELVTEQDDVETMASRLRELQASFSTLPSMRVCGNPLSALSMHEARNELLVELRHDRRAEVLILLLLRCKNATTRHDDDDDDDDDTVIEDMETLYLNFILPENGHPLCVRLAVALFGFCDLEPLILTRQLDIDLVACEYFSHRLPALLLPVVLETLERNAPWAESSALLDILLANATQGVFGKDPDAYLPLLSDRNLPPVDALSLLLMVLANGACTAAQQAQLLQTAVLHFADETEDVVSAARRLTLALHFTRSLHPELALEHASLLQGREELFLMHAQVLCGLLPVPAETLERAHPWAAMLVALHDPEAYSHFFGVLLTNLDEVYGMPPMVRKRIVDGALHALLTTGLINMLQDDAEAASLVANLLNVMDSFNATDLVEHAHQDSCHNMPFDASLNNELDLFPHCELKLHTTALTARVPRLFQDDWPGAQSTVLRCAVADTRAGAIARSAIAAAHYKFPVLR